jgi:hypothetical protein
MRFSEQFSFAGSDGVVGRIFCIAGCCVSSTLEQAWTYRKDLYVVLYLVLISSDCAALGPKAEPSQSQLRHAGPQHEITKCKQICL